MKKSLTIFAASVAASTMLAACGGGGSSGSDTGTVTAPLSVYAGTWQAPCDDHALETLTTSLKTDGSLEVAIKYEYFLSAACSGIPLATQTTSATSTLTYTGSDDAPIKLSTAATTTTVHFAKVNISVPRQTTVLTGTGLERIVRDNVPQLCFNIGGVLHRCIYDTGTIEAATTAGGLYISDNKLHLISRDSATYEVDGVYTRK